MDERGANIPLEPLSRPHSENITSPSFFDQATMLSPSISRDTQATISIPPTAAASSHSKQPSAASSSITLTPSYRSKWNGVIKDLPTPSFKNFPGSVRSGRSTPAVTPGTTPSHERGEWLSSEEKDRLAEKERKRKRKKAEVFVCIFYSSCSKLLLTNFRLRVMLLRLSNANNSSASLPVR
jgi:hypothetical protein